MTHTVETIDTPDGPFTAVAVQDGAAIASGWTASPDEALARVREQWRPQAVARSYYAGELDPVSAVPVALHGTDGQLAGWEQLRRIRPGDPQTYTEFAEVLGTPRAVRAAASVCARNPVALFVPCHRVLRSDGSMGGFAWGEDVKRSLLEREAAGRAR